MHRREALKNIALLLGSTLSITTLDFVLEGCTPSSEKDPGYFNSSQKQLIAQIAESIIPETDTPGAISADVPEFIVMMLEECYTKEVREIIARGLRELQGLSKKLNRVEFENASSIQRELVLKNIESEEQTNKPDDSPRFFQLLKELTLLGFFTSEKGATEVLKWIPVPGKYDACTPLLHGQTSWTI